MIDQEDKEAIHTIVGGVALFAFALYGMHIAGFRFSMGVGA